MQLIRIGSRKSPLALKQARIVADKIKKIAPDAKTQIVEIVTTGDKLQNAQLYKIGGKGVFLKEIQEALLDGCIDIAVHSMKDVPVLSADNLEISCIIEREDPRDVMIAKNPNITNLLDLPVNAIVGTSSPRRSSFISYYRKDIVIKEIRGNIQTRISKLESGGFDAIILAAAGLKRMGIESCVTQYFDIKYIVPSVAQGAIGIEHKKNNHEMKALLSKINCKKSYGRVALERIFQKIIGGDCTISMGAHAKFTQTGEINFSCALFEGEEPLIEHMLCDAEQIESNIIQIASKWSKKL